jgi:hypothetical protein
VHLITSFKLYLQETVRDFEITFTDDEQRAKTRGTMTVTSLRGLADVSLLYFRLLIRMLMSDN